MKTQEHLLPSLTPVPMVWKLLITLAVIQGLFTLSWVIYRAHLVSVLTQSGFSEQAAPQLLLIEALIAIALEPLIGALSDRTELHGSRTPWIAIGLCGSAGLFIAIAAWVVLGQPTNALSNAPRWEIIGLLLAWAIAMSVFRTPALALLKQATSTRYLPQAASLLTLAGGLAGATAAATPIIRNWGVVLSFGIAALLLGGTWIALNAYLLPNARPSESTERVAIAQPPSLLSLGLIFGLGFTTTWVLRIVVESFPKLLQTRLPDLNPALMIALIFITLALTALPSGIAAVHFGNRRVMLIGLGALMASLGLMTVPTSPAMAIVAAVALGISFGLVSNGTLPFTLSSVSETNAGLAVGMFFGGAATAVSCLGLFGKVLLQSANSPVWLGGLALLIAALCLTVPLQSNQS